MIPAMLAMIRAGAVDASISVELWGPDMLPVIFGSTPYASLTISSTAKTLGQFLKDAALGYEFPDWLVGGRLRVVSGGAIACNFRGSDALAASDAPTANSPLTVPIGGQIAFGRQHAVLRDAVATDANGNQLVSTEANDNTNNVMRSGEIWSAGTVLNADGNSLTGVGVCAAISVSNNHASNDITVSVFDNTSATGSKLCEDFTLAPKASTGAKIIRAPYALGVYFDFGGTGTPSGIAYGQAII